MRQVVPVKIGDAEFLVETVDTVDDPDRASGDGGLTPIGAESDADSFDRLRGMIEAVSGELTAVWERVRPDQAVVEFGVAADVKAGKLTGLLVSGGAAATLKVTLTWTSAPE
ncbi:CU044_2847 family protein [Glycomyces sp. NPDC046736]|uniref:CU044_2847 family protein n=1 Tax=Glycomyces sp. NPDC046736 TaxID=3155615 RepID=UPI0033F35A68